jgi:hypothetical protein
MTSSPRRRCGRRSRRREADWKHRGEESRTSFLMAIEIMRAVAQERRNFKVAEGRPPGSCGGLRARHRPRDLLSDRVRR